VGGNAVCRFGRYNEKQLTINSHFLFPKFSYYPSILGNLF